MENTIKFIDMKYERPDIQKLQAEYEKAIKEFTAATNAQTQIDIVYHLDKITRHVETMGTLCSIRHSINTKDSFYEKEQDFLDENAPKFEKLQNDFKKVFIHSTFRKELEKEFGTHIFNMDELSFKVFSEAIMDDLVIENKLVTQYGKLIASAQLQFDGKVLNLSQMAPYMSDPDRQKRKEACEVYWSFFEKHEKEFDEIYDSLVKVRTKIAKALGYKNFVQLGYDRMIRTDYNADMVKNYRKQIFESVVPYVQELTERKRKRLGLDHLYYYDGPLDFKTGNAVPQGDATWIVEQAQKMYSELSPETDDFFKMMTQYGLMDLVSKQGKAAGGYCTTIGDYKVPFIFANFNKTSSDVEVVTHEAGHAFQAYQSRNAKLLAYVWPTYEACEIHSMSMEFFTWPWAKNFFKEQTQKYQFGHLEGAITFLPYGAAVDEFQHWVYENAEVTPAERKAAWRKIERKYLPAKDYADNDFLNRGGFWFVQGHIFNSPFYYIDYTLAQVCALQFWVRSLQDRNHAWKDYLHLCRLGGSMPFLSLLREAKLKNPFENGCIDFVMPEVKKYLDGIDDAAL